MNDLYLPARPRQIAAGNEDAFDAAVSAVAMVAAVEELVALPAEPDYTLEGKIWQPRTLSAQLRSALRQVTPQANSRNHGDIGRQPETPTVCPQCFVVLPATELCDYCG